MKKFIVCVLLMSFIAGLALIFGNAENSVQATGEQAAYLRVHIRANSNSKEDQSVKYMVRDRVVAFLTPTVADCATKDEAIQKIGAKLCVKTAIRTVLGRVSEKKNFLPAYTTA